MGDAPVTAAAGRMSRSVVGVRSRNCTDNWIVVIIFLFGIIKRAVTIEAMKVMVKTMVTVNVKATVTAMFVAAVREKIEGWNLY